MFDNCTQTHARKESYRLDGFSIRQCARKCSLNVRFGLLAGPEASAHLLVTADGSTATFFAFYLIFLRSFGVLESLRKDGFSFRDVGMCSLKC